jgi:outer membrane biosynthesis protein TonB
MPSPQVSIGTGHAGMEQSIGMGNQPQPSWAAPQPNIAIGSGGQNIQQTSGGIDKRILIGAGVGILLLIILGLSWALFSSSKSNDLTDVTEQRPQQIEEPTQRYAPEDFEPSEEFEEVEEIEEVEEVEEVQEEPPPKPKKVTTKRTTPKSTSKTKTRTTPKSTVTKPKEPVKSAPTTVGVGEFSVTIKFEKPATLKCGDGQSKDFVNQTKMTFQTRTACRINTEDGEQGALSASKSGTIQCSLSGERIRCR